ncbi:hypothetical protein ABVK25_012451 [Lepraria finkii]|uniref:ATP citrate synthase n=1 Tax=Lepraria finkii TaxID=1340010 RepID=A0ABR4AEA5_9LECA
MGLAVKFSCGFGARSIDQEGGKSGPAPSTRLGPEARAWIEQRAGKKNRKSRLSWATLDNSCLCLSCLIPITPITISTSTPFEMATGSCSLHEGGVDVGDVDAKAEKVLIPVDLKKFPSHTELAKALLKNVPKGVHNVLLDFIIRLYSVYVDCQFTYLEINPLVVIPNADATSAEVHFLDLAAKLDQTADFECGTKWAIARSPAALGLPGAKADGKVNIDVGPPIDFPAPFGREMTKEEKYIADMDAKTGASLKLTILNSQGRIWTLVAGGGASVVYADAITSAGFVSAS